MNNREKDLGGIVRINPYESEAYQSFVKAYKMDVSRPVKTEYEVWNVLEQYKEAVCLGCVEACVNAISLILETELPRCHDDSSCYFRYGELLVDIIEVLQKNHHPAGDYFYALALCCGLGDEFICGSESELDVSAGIMKMQYLVHVGNPYAMNYASCHSIFKPLVVFGQS